MASIVWGRHPQEAYDNPYEYEAQDQFIREAKQLLSELQLRLDCFVMQFHTDDRTLEKASWMLSVDLIDSLLESVQLLAEKRHRVAFRLFRDAVETIDLLNVLHSNNSRAQKTLSLWYENETIPHKESRMHIEEQRGTDAAFKRRDYYAQLSKFTHRTYGALQKSYSLGMDNMLVHDSHSMRMLVLPQTISSGLAILADLIIQASDTLVQSGILIEGMVKYAWLVSLEINSAPRRFTPSKPLNNY